MSHRGSTRIRLRHLLLGAYLALAAAALTWPGYAPLGNRVEPFVLGLPFSMAWNVGWILLTFLGLTAYHLSRRRP